MKVLEKTIKNEIYEFKEQIDKFLAGTINEEKFKTIRLNLGIYSQRQPGFYMVRAKLPQGRMFDYQLERIADVADQFGRGLAHLTTRQDIQIHWVELKNVIDVLTLYAEVGITTREACGNSVRNVTACPFAGICPKEIFDVSNISHTTTIHFLRNPISQNLPRKFKISFSGCDDDCAYSRINDIGFLATVNNNVPGFRVYVGGGLGGHPRSAFLLKDFIPYNQAVLYADAVVRVFDRYGNRANRNMARLKYVFEEKGVETLKQIIEEEFAEVKEIYGDSTFEEMPDINNISDPFLPKNEVKTIESMNVWYMHNVVKQKQQDYYAITVQIPFGETNSKNLRDIAKISRMYGTGEIRTSLDQNFIIPWIHVNNIEGVYEELKYSELIAQTDTILNIVSCPGAKTCNLGIARSQGLAKAIQDELNAYFKHDLSDISIRVCGCPNACAQHHIANIGFSGMARRI
ncbi:MAG: nitrite/sulfite reductase, partial [bacterium]